MRIGIFGTGMVKALNTVNREVMVDPARVPGEHDIFLCGDDAEAKEAVTGLLEQFGWPPERILDLRDITAARALELYVVLWIRVRGVLATTDFNIHVVR